MPLALDQGLGVCGDDGRGLGAGGGGVTGLEGRGQGWAGRLRMALPLWDP